LQVLCLITAKSKNKVKAALAKNENQKKTHFVFMENMQPK